MTAPEPFPRDDLSWPMRTAILLNRVLPRGKGAVPRWIGARIRGGPTRRIVTRHGASLVVEPSSLDVYAHIVNAGRTWNWNVLATCAAIVRPGSTFYDIGANIGFVTNEIARIFSAAETTNPVRIVAFEPLPTLAAAVRESARINGFDTISVRDAVVSDADGTTDLYLGSHTIHASTRARESASRVLRCPMARIDTLVAAGTIPPPDAIKIDVEGGELSAFKGAAETIRAHRPHLVFESDENTRRFGYSRGDLLALLTGFGPYRFWRIAPAGDALQELDRGSSATEDPADVLAAVLDDHEIGLVSARLHEWGQQRRITVEGM